MTPWDIENLNRSMEGVGQAFAQNRAQALQSQHYGIEAAMRERMLDAEQRRLTAEEGRQDLLSQGTVDATLQDEDGNQVSWRGPSNSYQGFVDNLKAKSGKDWTAVSEPKKTPYSVKLNLPDGEMELHANDLDELQTQVDHMRKANKTQAKNQSPSYGPVQADKAATDLEDQADKIDAQAQGIPTPSSDRLAAAQQSARLRQRAAALRASMQKPEPLVKLGEQPTGGTTLNPGKQYIYGTRQQATQPQPTATVTNAAPGAPAVGTVSKGYRFKGGDPSMPDSWEKVK